MATPANPNWSRWVFASIATYFQNIATENDIPLYIEGLSERTDAFQTAPERAELRINGPWTQEMDAGVYRLWVDVNILLISQYGGNTKNAYDCEVNLGIFQQAVDQPIYLYKYGTGGQDDQSQFGYLTPRVGPQDCIRVLRFGQVESNAHMRQEMVDARLFTHLYL
jgi:hypothetical protein